MQNNLPINWASTDIGATVPVLRFNPSNTFEVGPRYSADYGMSFYIGSSTVDYNWYDNSNNASPLMTLTGTGDLGVGDISPTSTLDVDGNARIRTIGQNDALSRVLVSDNDGNINWRDASSLGSDSHNFPGYPASAGDSGSNTNSYFGHEAGVSNTGDNNTFIGHQSGFNNTLAGRNTAIGTYALYTQSFDNGGLAWNTDNVAVGFEALYSNQPTNGGNFADGRQNTAIGVQALRNNTEGNWNTANGHQALYANTTGISNTANGTSALRSNTTGRFNAANGAAALRDNTEGDYNTANGFHALINNTTGNGNTANGEDALQSNTEGNSNTANGRNALNYNTTGNNNTANGHRALYNNETGNNNTATGHRALYYDETGSFNTAIGNEAGPANGNDGLSNSTAIGNEATITASNQIRIGNDQVTSIGGYAAWSNLSDGRFKKNIQEDIPGLEFITQLRPVSYEIDRSQLRTFLKKEQSSAEKITEINPQNRSIGFVAQEVEQVIEENNYMFSGVEKPQNESDHYSIRYAEFVVPLIKGMQEQQQLIETMQQMIADQQQEIETLKNLVYGADSAISDNNTQTKSRVIDTKGFALHQNVPNPFQQTTTISALVPEQVQQAKIVISNLQGAELASYPVNDRGNVAVNINKGHLSSGIYLYTLVAEGRIIDTKKMILTK